MKQPEQVNLLVT